MTTSPTPDPEPYDHLFGGHWTRAQAAGETWLSRGEDPQPVPYAEAPGQRYILPCPVLGLGGLYEYYLVNTEAARRWVMAGPLLSYVTHPQLKGELDRVLGIFTPPGMRGPLPQLGYHDEAMLWQVEGFELLAWQGRGNSKRLRQMVQEELWTLGLLKRLA